MNHVAPDVTIHASQQKNGCLSEATLGRQSNVTYTASTTSYRRGEPMRIQAGSGECWGRIVGGAARLCVLQNAGRRRIIDFQLPGDLLVPAACGPGFDLEPVCDGTVMAVSRSLGAGRWAAADPYVPREVREPGLAMASRFRRQILILGHSTAMGKLCAFLVEMQQRSAGNQPDTIVLPMSRYDIADYLAISVETVSRSLTALQARKAIALVNQREIKILDRGAIENGLLAT